MSAGTTLQSRAATGEAPVLVEAGKHYCPMCAEDNGRDVLMRLDDFCDIRDGECRARELMAQVERQRLALAKAGEQFDYYARLHRKKGTLDGEAKARANEQFAAYCREAMAPEPEA